VRIPIRNMFRYVLEDQLSVDATLPTTLKLLFFQPGRLTREYVELHIARYIHPFRLYLLASLLFFLSLSLLPRFSSLATPTAAEADSLRAAIDSVRAEGAASGDSSAVPGGRVGVTVNPTDANWAENAEVHLGNDALNAAIKAKLVKLGAMDSKEALRTVSAEFVRQSPKVMFLVLPLYALLLKVLYARRDYFYAEHFAFALHVHAFTFFLLFLWLILHRLPFVTAAVWLWLPFYSLFAMKRFYRQGWLKTFLKWTILGWSYVFVVCLGLIVGLLLTIASV
jgi:hypothetical protein